jgi:hypothetical protein
MGVVTGITSHKLDVIRTYDPANPYVVGTNGVTALYTNSSGNDVVEYTIGNIRYKTILFDIIPDEDNPSLFVNNPNSINKPYIPKTDKNDKGRGIINTQLNFPTTFEYTTSATTTNNYFVFKEEVKMGVVFPTKIYEDVFIERQRMSVFESQSRLGTIITLEDLEEYNNGYYNVTKTE